MTPNKMIITEKEKKKKRTDMLHSNICIQTSRSMGILCKYGQPDLTQDAIALRGWGQ